MDWVNDFWTWAWARHANELSWYIRPLFFLPFCFFAYRRSIAGMVSTVVAVFTSMFWFPAPAQPKPEVLEFLKMEQEYLLGAWTLEKTVLTLTVPLAFIGLALAFWFRRWQYGLVILVAVAVGKIVWSAAFGGASGTAVMLPASVGLVVCVGVVFWVLRRSARTPDSRVS
jgi:hypothetical protein